MKGFIVAAGFTLGLFTLALVYTAFAFGRSIVGEPRWVQGAILGVAVVGGFVALHCLP